MNLFGTSATANQITRAIGSGESELLPSDKFLNYDRTEGSVTIVLPQINDYINYIGGKGNTLNINVFLSDITPSASVNAATLTCDIGDNINGESSVVISATGDSNFCLQPTPSGWLLTTKGAAGGVGATGATGATGIGVISFSVEIPTSEVLTGNSIPVLLVAAPPAGYQIELITSALTVNFNSAAYDTNTTVNLIIDTATMYQHIITGGLNATLTRTLKGNTSIVSPSASSTMMIESKALYFIVAGGDPMNGDSDIIVYGTYILQPI